MQLELVGLAYSGTVQHAFNYRRWSDSLDLLQVVSHLLTGEHPELLVLIYNGHFNIFRCYLPLKALLKGQQGCVYCILQFHLIRVPIGKQCFSEQSCTEPQSWRAVVTGRSCLTTHPQGSVLKRAGRLHLVLHFAICAGPTWRWLELEEKARAAHLFSRKVLAFDMFLPMADAFQAK